jgi:hypothetical protein
VLDEQQASGRPKHATHFVEGIKDSRNTHNVQVVTTVSALASSRGILSAEPSMNSTDRAAERLARRAMARSFGEGSSPIT